MAVVTILDQDKRLTDREAIAAYLKTCGIDYEQWTPSHPVAVDAPAADILHAYSAEIDELKARVGVYRIPIPVPTERARISLSSIAKVTPTPPPRVPSTPTSGPKK